MHYAKWMTLVAALGIASASIGCGGATPDAETPVEVEVGAKERILQYRTTLGQLRDSRFAKEAKPDLDMAESWLADADAQLRSEDPQLDLVELLLQAARGQLVKVRSFYGRRESESTLEELRGDYEQQKQQIEELRDNEETK